MSNLYMNLLKASRAFPEKILVPLICWGYQFPSNWQPPPGLDFIITTLAFHKSFTFFSQRLSLPLKNSVLAGHLGNCSYSTPGYFRWYSQQGGYGFYFLEMPNVSIWLSLVRLASSAVSEMKMRNERRSLQQLPAPVDALESHIKSTNKSLYGTTDRNIIKLDFSTIKKEMCKIYIPVLSISSTLHKDIWPFHIHSVHDDTPSVKDEELP